MAIRQRQLSSGLIVHLDRGSQYASELYQSLLNASQTSLADMFGATVQPTIRRAYRSNTIAR